MRFVTVQKRLHTYWRRLLDAHTRAVVQLPRWRHPLIGYLVGLLLIGLGLGMGLVETQLLSPFSFPGVPLLFAIVLVALFWGVGPAIFSILLSLLVLDYLYIAPTGVFSGYGWEEGAQLLTFAAAGIVIAILTSQRESTRLRAIAAEQEAVAHARQLTATFEAINDGIVVYNRREQVLQTNAATCSLFGIHALTEPDQVHAADELLRQAARHDEQGHLLPEKRQPLSRIFKGERLTGPKAADVQVRTPDGREIVLNMSGAPIRGDAGSIERAVLIYRDVTQRRYLERRTSQALEALLEMAHVLVQVPDHAGQEEQTSPAGDLSEQVAQRFAELAASVIESKHVALLAIEPEEERAYPLACRGFTSRQEQQWRAQLAHSPELINQIGSETLVSQLKNDEILLLDGMSLPVYAPVLPYYVQAVLVAPICVNNRLVGLLCMDDGSREHIYTPYEEALIQTITRLAAQLLLRAQLQRDYALARANELAQREANRRMEEFLGIVCHELKTPLTVMRGSIQLAERKVKRLVATEVVGADELRRFAPVQALLERARYQVAIQDRLVNDLLDASRVQARTLRLAMNPCNLVSIVQEAVEDQRQIAVSRTLRLEPPSQADMPVHGDADRLAQVVVNYLTNALKYSPSDRPIAVRLAARGHIARVSVQDQGPGLAETEHEQIWERFYRVPDIEAQSESVGGLGVGLYLCRTIIEQHGGQVGVQSAPGQGATFWFTLPLIQPARQTGTLPERTT